MKKYAVLKILILFVFIISFSGCTVIFQKGRRSDMEKISDLSRQIDLLSQSKSDLEQRLAKEIAAKEVSLSMQDRGLVVTFVSEVLFDSGKAKIKSQAYNTLDKVAEVLMGSAAGMEIGVEGHTDNDPIKYSGWESNWDLSGARAKSVLSYMISKGVGQGRLSFTGYGEYKPVASNDTKEGRQKNRRVEIIIKNKAAAQAQEAPQAAQAEPEPTENLK